MGALSEGVSTARKSPTHHSSRIIVSIVVLLAFYLNFGYISSYVTRSPAQRSIHVYYAEQFDKALEQCRRFQRGPISYQDVSITRRSNPRWNDVTGQNRTIVLQNVTFFDGEGWSPTPVNVIFTKGVITHVLSVSASLSSFSDAHIVDVEGRFVTPGLVDMHSHHLVETWPALRATEDTNEVNDKSLTGATGPLTPFVRSKDSMKPYDMATDIIRSGGITSSLILPGSANIMGGEAYVVKNVLRSGRESEENVDEMFLEYGVPEEDKRRYMKMACGENPRRVYGHTRMGNVWIFRKHMERAAELKQQQDAWCHAAEAAHEMQDANAVASLAKAGLPEELQYESSIGMLRGQVDLHNHCYEPEDFQAMLRTSNEFGFTIRAFHHALSAWKVPELIKASGQNITIATFSDFGFYKQEGYEANLYAGKILEEHGVPVAYKSDHNDESTNAKYLLFEAQNAHRFGMSEEAALRAVTSTPARSLRLEHRIGFAKPGSDADLVIWSDHPLSVGATPLQVYVDGRKTLDESEARKHLSNAISSASRAQNEQIKVDELARVELCDSLSISSNLVVTGMKKSFIRELGLQTESRDELTAVVTGGRVACFGSREQCIVHHEDVPTLHLQNGHIAPGLIAVTTGLGLEEIPAEISTGDGGVPSSLDISDPSNLIYAHYGVRLKGKAFKRAQIGGVTRAVSIPHVDEGGFGGAVSVGILTSEKNSTLDGGIFQNEVGLHFVIGQGARKSTETVSGSIAKLRKILRSNSGKDNVYGAALRGEMPLIVHTENHYDILQLVATKRDFGDLNLVIYGGAEAPLVANEIAAANISLIFTRHRGAPDTWEKKDMLTGPPLTPSPVGILKEAGVRFALAIENYEGNSFIHNTPIEASWAAKYAGLSDEEAIDLVSPNVENILGLKKSNDIVIWEGNPLEFGAMPAVVINQDAGRVVGCWPSAT